MKELFLNWMNWSKKKFKKADQFSSLEKLKGEINELEASMETQGYKEVADEYADCFMCLLHSMSRSGVTLDEFEAAFKNKFITNIGRKWKLNANNTYSHV